MKKIIKVNTQGKKAFYVKKVNEGILLTKDIEKAKDYFDNDKLEEAEHILKNYYGERKVFILTLETKGLRTDEGVSISRKILKGRTFVSRVREKAEEVADAKRSYIYDVFFQGRFWGYGVPN